jgi:hypothetical protein
MLKWPKLAKSRLLFLWLRPASPCKHWAKKGLQGSSENLKFFQEKSLVLNKFKLCLVVLEILFEFAVFGYLVVRTIFSALFYKTVGKKRKNGEKSQIS